MFDKSEALFPVRRQSIYLGHCAVGPMYAPAAAAASAFIQAQSELGLPGVEAYSGVLSSFRVKAAELFRSAPENVAYVPNTAMAMNLIANGYPFEPGDQVVSYIHEYPSNHYPWRLQERRGVELVLLSDVDPIEGGSGPAAGPRGWSFQELEEVVTERTRVIALSHVQFTSGFATELRPLGHFCRERGIDLVIDAAQSLGVLPVHPEEYGVAAVAASTWKWLLASRGSGLLYTSPALREKLEVTQAGEGMMQHRLKYLDHTWNPDPDARRFEYSTLPWEHLVVLESVLDEVFLRYGVEEIGREVIRLQDILLSVLRTPNVRARLHRSLNRSGILSFSTREDPRGVVEKLRKVGVVATAQGGYLRIAPHFYLEDEEIFSAGEALNAL